MATTLRTKTVTLDSAMCCLHNYILIASSIISISLIFSYFCSCIHFFVTFMYNDKNCTLTLNPQDGVNFYVLRSRL